MQLAIVANKICCFQGVHVKAKVCVIKYTDFSEKPTKM